MQVDADKCSSKVREEGTMEANAQALHLPTNAEVEEWYEVMMPIGYFP